MPQTAYSLYRCLLTHQVGARIFYRDVLYNFTSDPGSRFEVIANLGDPRLPAPAAMLDHDGTWYPGVHGWDDFSFSLTAGKLGVLDKPDYDYDEHALAFPQDDATEVVYLHRISPHSFMIHPDAYWFPHIHLWQDQGLAVPVFEYRYRIDRAGATVSAFSEWTESTGDLEFTYSEGTIHQVMHFPAFNAYQAGHITPAVSVDVELRRNDDLVTGDVLVKSFDFHVPIDAPMGSGQQFLK